MDAVFQIGSAPDALFSAPSPAAFRVRYADPGLPSARSVNGSLLPGGLRTGESAVRHISLTWRQLSSEVCARLFAALSQPRFFLRCPDPLLGAARTACFAPQVRAASAQPGPDGLLFDLELSAVEV